MEIVNEKELIELGYLKKVVHENNELFLYNYTNKAQFEKAWKQYPQLLQCRGLILDILGNIIARPFPKFFNIEEVEEFPSYTSFEITDKLDGSLIIVSFYKEEMIISTRGSFNSTQAIKAKELLHDCMRNQIYYGYTFLFELIGKKNQIVVNYEEDYKLVLLSIVRNDEGYELPRDSCLGWAKGHHLDIVQTFDGISDFKQCRELLKRDNAEGFVVKLDNGFRFKLKYADYVRLHKLLTGVSERDILDMIKNNQDINTLLDRVPDEYYKWVQEIKERIEMSYSLIEKVCLAFLSQAKKLYTRKEQAEFILSQAPKYSAIIFKMLDNKKYCDIIYKLIDNEIDGTNKFKVEL